MNKPNRNNFDYLENLAVVSDAIQPFQRGRIYFRASWWPAICSQEIVLNPGEKVLVIGMKNITCIVEPFSS
jgi:membrane protein implicated in regulation of membrane protease activity